MNDAARPNPPLSPAAPAAGARGIGLRVAGSRIDWVDYAKGICIILVVMMHSTLGVEAARGGTGFMHAVVEFAKPFRMPDFFLLSGLFLSLVIDRDWRTYLDRKVVHFGYFYVLWVFIQFAFKAPFLAHEHGWATTSLLLLETSIEPFGTLWFIYLLPVFFVVTKLTRRAPIAIVWIAAALLEAAHIKTGSTLIDEFAARFVYFYSGYVFAPHVFALAARAREAVIPALAGLAAWALINGGLVHWGIADMPGVSLMLGFLGALAIVTIGALLAQAKWPDALRFCGEHSIVIYLAFFLPMAATRTLLLKTGFIADIGLQALLVTIAGVFGALLIWWLTRVTGYGSFLFTRPDAFWIAPRKAAQLQAAE